MTGRGAIIRAAGLAVALTASVAIAQSAADGPYLIEETYRDWILRCDTVAGDPQTTPATQVCEMTQERSEAEAGQRVLRTSVQATDDGPVLTLLAPFRTCLPQGCMATAQLDTATLARLDTGGMLDVDLIVDAGQPVVLAVSLDGFHAAWARLAALREG
ncbi:MULTISPECIES: invasion associated locus B family protein [unclassified Yoonia]|uniref:invasion associated locus B family protein n=1 Tax=unclassified Yoonia TaxID=2629118 RepID=UPI002AFE1201|nr:MULTISPECIES: invasion associated locus B family protein [unclassified Yoonia]